MIISTAALAAALTQVGAVADVTTSDDKTYQVRTCFVEPDRLTTVFSYPDRTDLLMISGERASVSSGERRADATDFHKRYAFGHNFHAIFLNFDRLISDPHLVEGMKFGDSSYGGLKGTIPYGGTATKVVDGDETLGLRLDLPDSTPIEVHFSDWREAAVGQVPYRLNVRHEGRTFDYRYRMVQNQCGAGRQLGRVV